MRMTVFFTAAALASAAAPAFAQNLTIPAGALNAMQAPVDSRVAVPAPTFQGRSVVIQPMPTARAHHAHRRG